MVFWESISIPHYMAHRWEGSAYISWQVCKMWLVRQDLPCWWSRCSRWSRWSVMMDFPVKGPFGSCPLPVHYPWQQCWLWRWGKFDMAGLQDMQRDHKRWEIDFCLHSLKHSFQLATLVKAWYGNFGVPCRTESSSKMQYRSFGVLLVGRFQM